MLANHALLHKDKQRDRTACAYSQVLDQYHLMHTTALRMCYLLTLLDLASLGQAHSVKHTQSRGLMSILQRKHTTEHDTPHC